MILHLCLIFSLQVICDQAETVLEEEANAKWSNGTTQIAEVDKHPALPDTVVLNISINNDTIVLNLTKVQSDDSENIPVIVGVQVWNHSLNEEFSVYSDISKDASFSVATNKKNGTLITEYYGFFVHKSIKYSLLPATIHEQSNKTAVIVHNFNLNGTMYVFYEDTTDKSNKSVNDTVVPQVDVKNTTSQTSSANSIHFNETQRSQRIKRSAGSKNLVVDLLIVIDNSMYNRWLLFNDGNKGSTVGRLRYYLAHVINGVNNVYATMWLHKLSVNVITIYIAETPLQSPFTEAARVYGLNTKRINFHAALINFNKWVIEKTLKNGEFYSQYTFLPPHNIALAFTDYNDIPIAGLAYIGTVCGSQAQGLVTEKGQYETISVVAHELGHNLGADHDNNELLCPPSHHYLMSPQISNTHIQNRDKFSWCTIQFIQKKVKQLELMGQNCLDSSKKRIIGVDLRTHLRTLPGLIFGLDKQCKMIFGNEYKYCSEGRYTHLKVCSNLKCSLGNVCYSQYPIALDGTSCGKGKWCMKGQCVDGEPTATSKKETCLYGNAIGIIDCNTVVRSPRDCYRFEDVCCETCDKFKIQKNIFIQGCAYGDMDARLSIHLGKMIYECQSVFLRPDLCYQPYIVKNCCESCYRVMPNLFHHKLSSHQ